MKRGLKMAARRLGVILQDAPEDLEASVSIFNADGAEIGNLCVPTGTTLLVAARQAKVDIDHYCGGQCSCGTCRINVLNGAENLSKISGMEEMTLGAKNMQAGCRLSCQARALGPVSFQVPRWF